jgi:hypothetical protein
MLTWLDGRNDSPFESITYSGGTLTFTIVQGSVANGLQGMLPAQTSSGILVSLMRGSIVVPFTVQAIKGVAYATFTAVAGAHTAVYSGPPDTTITASPAATITAASASFTFTATPAAGAAFRCSLDGAAFATCMSPRNYTGLALGAHTFEVRGANLAGADATPASTTFTVLVPETSITANPGAATAGSTATFSFAATPSAGPSFECALDNPAFAACTSPKTYTGITVGSHTFRVRAVASAGTDATPASHTWMMTALVAAFGSRRRRARRPTIRPGLATPAR